MRRQAFEGIKVVDFGWVGTIPFAVKYLADHGAEVIRIESSIRVDTIRVTPPYKDNIPGVNRSAFFANYNNNKYGITLNLNHPRGVEVAKRIVAWADIVAEGYLPGAMARRGLGYENLRAIKPDIIMLSSCNQGQTGPFASMPGFGTQLSALAGLTYITGWADEEPAVVYAGPSDVIAARAGAIALIAALDYRRRTGKGQYIDMSQLEASVHLLAPLILDFTINGRIANRMGNRCSYAVPHGVYPCKGRDRWCAIAIFTDEEWQAFCQTAGNQTWTKDPRFSTILRRVENEEELDRRVAGWTSSFTAEELMVMLQSAGVAAGIVETCEDFHNDPQIRHRHHLWELKHPEIGRHTYEGPGFTLSKTPCELRMPAPCLGQHNEYVCTKLLGMSDEEFIELLQEGVFE